MFYPVVAFLTLWILEGNELFFDKSVTNQYGKTINPRGSLLWLLGVFAFSLMLLKVMKLPTIFKTIIALLFIYMSWITVDDKGTVSSGTYVSWFIWVISFLLGGLFTDLVIFKKFKINQQLINFTIIFSLAGIGISDPSASSLIAVIAIPVAVLSGSNVASSITVGTILAISIGINPTLFGNFQVWYLNYFAATAGVLHVILNKENLYFKTNVTVQSLYWLSIIILIMLISYILFSLNKLWLKDYYYIVFFSLILPIINAPIDWLSLGVTRGLLTAIRKKHHNTYQALIWIIIDVMLALVFLIAISIIVIIAINIINKIANTNLISINDFLDNPFSRDHYWIHFTVLSTLIPTFLHLMMIGGTITLWIPRKIRLKMASNLESNNFKIFGAWLYLTFIPFLGFIFTPFLIVLLLFLIINNFDGGLANFLKFIMSTTNDNLKYLRI